MNPRDRYMLLLVVGVLVAGAITVAVGTAISVTGRIDGQEPALIIPVLLAAALAVWALSRRGPR